MKRILPFLDKYSNVLIAFSACLTTIATFLIWDISREQTKLTSIMGKASERPVIEIDYISETLGAFDSRNNTLGGIIGKGKEIRTIRLTNVGRGSAFKLKIEFRGEKTKKNKGMGIGNRSKGIEIGIGSRSNTRTLYIEGNNRIK